MNNDSKYIVEIHSMPPEKMMKYFNMTNEERLEDFLRHLNMGKILEDTIVFPPGREIDTDIPESLKEKSLGPRLSYKGMGWSKIDPHMYANIINRKTTALEIINNIKNKKTNILKFSFQKLLDKLKRKKG